MRTVLHAPIVKQEMLQQQDFAVPSVQWKMNRTSVNSWETSAGYVVGDLEMETSVQQEKTFLTENVLLQPALQITNLQYGRRRFSAGRNCTHLRQHGLCGPLRQVSYGCTQVKDYLRPKGLYIPEINEDTQAWWQWTENKANWLLLMTNLKCTF